MLADFCDGSYFKDHALFSIYVNTILYYDDVEVCNPLGVHTKVHKAMIHNICTF